MKPLCLVSHSVEETQEIGRRLGELAQAGDVILLVGELGTGKTCLTQGIAWGLGIKEHTRSPTFVMVSEYKGRLPLYHIDLYRVESQDEAIDLGLDDYLYSGGVSVVEWADRALETLPPEHLLVHIDYKGETQRSLVLEPKGKRYEDILGGLARAWPARK